MRRVATQRPYHDRRGSLFADRTSLVICSVARKRSASPYQAEQQEFETLDYGYQRLVYGNICKKYVFHVSESFLSCDCSLLIVNI
jgi:hypothetical protein